MALKRNRYKLVEGVWYRWEGTKEEGRQVLYTRAEGNNLIDNVTPMELRIMKDKIKLVGGTPPLDTLSDDVIVPLEGEFEDLTDKTPKKGLKPATVKTVTTPPPPDADTGDDGDGEKTFASVEEFLDQNIPDVVALIGAIKDVDQLKAIKSAEKKGKARKGVLTAIDEQLESV